MTTLSKIYCQSFSVGLSSSVNTSLLIGKRYSEFAHNQYTNAYKRTNYYYPGAAVGLKATAYPLKKKRYLLIDFFTDYTYWRHKTTWKGVYDNTPVPGETYSYSYEIEKKTGDVSLGIMIGYSIIEKINISAGFALRFPVQGKLRGIYSANNSVLYDEQAGFYDKNIELIHYYHKRMRIDLPLRISYSILLKDKLIIEPFISTRLNIGWYESYDFGYYGVVEGHRIIFCAGVSLNYLFKKQPKNKP